MKKYIKVIILNVAIILVMIAVYKSRYRANVIDYLMYNSSYASLKDLLSMTATSLSVFIGFIVAIDTVLLSMCDKRIIKLIKAFNKADVLLSFIRNSIIFGLISLLGILIVYSNLDFNILILRLVILYVVLNCTIIFSINGTKLVLLINKVLKDSLNGNEDLVIKVEPNIDKQ